MPLAKAAGDCQFTELTQVTLSRPVQADEGVVPAGSVGTIVHVWRGGAACEVEFSDPFETVATVRADDLAA